MGGTVSQKQNALAQLSTVSKQKPPLKRNLTRSENLFLEATGLTIEENIEKYKLIHATKLIISKSGTNKNVQRKTSAVHNITSNN